jgi:hypothetical protein
MEGMAESATNLLDAAVSRAPVDICTKVRRFIELNSLPFWNWFDVAQHRLAKL